MGLALKPRRSGTPAIVICEIGERFGDARREWVAMELEYPTPLTEVCAP